MSDKKSGLLCGTVTRAQAGIYHVHIHNDGSVIGCFLRGKLKRNLMAEDGKRYLYTNPVAVGDEVMVTLAEGGKGAIEAILPRRSKLSRSAAGPVPLEQIVVANVDQIIIILSTKMPQFKTRLLDRFLVIAGAENLTPIICINKMDLLNDSENIELYQKTRTYEKIGYKVLYVSALKGEGLGDVINIMKGKLSALMGQSGTGKSTLLNAIQPNLLLRTAEVSKKTQKGKHVTSEVQLYPLDFGGYVADTPGIRELGFWGISQDEIDLYFPEMKPYLGRCKFHDCSHIQEPACAVKEAVAQGNITEERYESYVRMRLGVSRDEES